MSEHPTEQQTVQHTYASEPTTVAVPTPDEIRQLAYKAIAAKEMLAAAQNQYDEANWRYINAALEAANHRARHHGLTRR